MPGAEVAAPEPRRADLVLALRDSTSVGLATVPVGLAFGVLVSQSGLPWWWATLSAAVIFAGSLEFLVLGMVTAFAPLAQIAITSFMVNFRHVFYSLSFPLHRVNGAPAKLYSTYTLTDEAYALTTGPDAQTWSRTRIVGLQALIQAYWVASATIGVIGGSFIPAGVKGLDFAITALFLVLGMDAFRVRRDIPGPLVAAACALVGRVAFGNDMLVFALPALAAFLMAKYAVRRRGWHA
ncbi:AzlC family ABC transporter permease [Leekyejoonella antrihumi]|uniref:AzlC family ABC transporter permease n=1 Tax=Leekyejoonella antrihumi TaxID=1660198 RepID=A0A563E549_9MICO|nr:AzlC family ABC transporter permease [Leekyejoonella antrihumi]TWP37321.1 AzlC family ABC transporter permease [Leekyejoonella antrihumi]